jgi:hypothetical protein
MADFKEAHSFFPQPHRLLQEDAVAIPPNDSAVLRNTFMIYGSILVVVFLLFCYARKRFPRPYALRAWVEDLKVNTLFIKVANPLHAVPLFSEVSTSSPAS